MLSDDQRREVDDRIELLIRRYFDHYLEKVLPTTLAQAFDAHNQNCGAHGGVTKRLSRLRWLLIGLAAGSGYGLAKLLAAL